MKTRVFTVSSLLASLALLLALLFTLAVAAQEPASQPMPFQDWEGGKPLPIPSGASTVQDTGDSAVALGEPGLSFRYVQTFGETEVGYPEDTDHFYDIAGIGLDGTDIWIVDSWGNRVLKFNSDGSFLQQIGKASFREATGTSLDYLSDIAIDSSGNIWVADAGTSHVAKFDSSGQHVGELGQAWNSGSGNDRFNDPLSVAFDSAGNIYVSDSGVWGEYGNHRIQVFDGSGNYLATIGQTGVAGSDNDHFRSPRHITIDGTYLYVADAGNHRVQILNISNPAAISYVATIGVSGVAGSDSGHFDYPEGVGVDANYLYVADSNNDRIQIFNRVTRAYVATIGTGAYGTGDYEFNHPSDVVVDSAGRIYVADNSNKRVQQYDSSRTYLRTYGTTGVSYITDGYHYNYPSGVAVDAGGSIYIVESRGHRVIKLNPAGEPQWAIGQPGQNGEDADHLFFPNGVALDRAGHIYVADTVNNRVQIFESSGTYYATLGDGQGTGDYQFDQPYGVAVDPAGNIYVADVNNHRIQVYDANLAHIGTIGVTGVAGSDNSHFDGPHDVAVDSAGNVYVADVNNHRVQRCVPNGSNWTCATIVGETGVSGSDLGHLSNPTGVAVDAAGRIYVADGWGWRVQVFDNTGDYLTTVGGSTGNRTGQMRQADGLALDEAGSLYVADYLNHRIQKFAPGVPGWRQVNINGFGERSNSCALSLTPYGTDLYAGTYSWSGDGAQLWRQTALGDWSLAKTGGLGNAANEGIDHLIEFDGQLYAGTWANDVNGGEVWRSGNGTNWVRVVSQGFGDPTNAEVFRFAVFDNQLYASTQSYAASHGGEVWRSDTGDSGDWAQVVSDGFDGDADNVSVLSFGELDGYLYAGTSNYATGGEVWRSSTGDLGTWTQANTDGFGDAGNGAVSALAAFDGSLYASTGHTSGAGSQVWRCQDCDGSDWEKVVDNGQGNADSRTMPALEVFEGRLYAVIGNRTTGLEVWRTADGSNWEQIGFAGLGDSNNNYAYWDNSVTVSGSRFFVSTCNGANGGEVWLYLTAKVYLPLVVRSH